MAFGRRWLAAAVCVPLLAVGCSDEEPDAQVRAQRVALAH